MPVSVSNAPANTPLVWALPAGWSFAPGSATNAASVTLTAGTAGGTIGVSAVGGAGCNDPVTPATVNVTGAGSCPATSYTITRDNVLSTSPGFNKKFTLGGVPLSCLPDGQGNSANGITYVWTADKVGGGTQTTTNYADGTVSFGVQVPPGGFISVIITNTNTCFNVSLPTRAVARQAAPGASSPTTKTTGPQLSSYPNPSGEVLNVGLSGITEATGTARLVLVDVLGRVVQETTANQDTSQLNTGKLPNGIYTLRAVLPNGKSMSQAVQVQH